MKNLRERIGLKILKLIDRYVDSFEKRIFIFIVFITIYWLWQNIWQLILFSKLFFITDYESLFNLQAHLSNYESSVLIRIIYYVISNPSLNIAGVVSCIKLIDIMGIVGLLILAQKYRIIIILPIDCKKTLQHIQPIDGKPLHEIICFLQFFLQSFILILQYHIFPLQPQHLIKHGGSSLAWLNPPVFLILLHSLLLHKVRLCLYLLRFIRFSFL